MKRPLFDRTSLLLAISVLLLHPLHATAGEIKVLCSNGIKAVMQELVPKFEQLTTHKVVVSYSVAADLKRRIDAGEPFDIAVLTPALIDEAIGQGKIGGDTRIVLARSAMAIAVRAGTPKVDISTIDGFKKALVASTSIAYAREGATGVAFAALVDRLGLTAALSSRFRVAATGDEVSASIVRGDAQLGVLPVSEIVSVRGLEVLGIFPDPSYIVMVAGISASSLEGQVAGQLIQFLTAPAARAILEQNGMER